ncbi:bifunctional hydroxymethylpyrimidine kinase/phosphomethylpyrimidine kinase [Ferruginivarius sediminum]|uniref:hydroxymethylpyrimidine kinase n=1 Tax=Ferruginivarius sediminum TaxID=2661937 RepID=A0A369T9H1_9PROT|nr:bifunctional hydroxymethylpyrimidine kinase/phosphomethylpyrimidine kinase [Ferruginivarius sediminum]RDD61963.1 bifunctional hydroxymethylpyrimidine kinase/phosphomethylpyrimidine kinase [Ferruginivarius sediminum]
MSAGGGKRGRVLIVAGSDSGGGAGIQADIKTVTCLGGYAMTAITALTAQNTQGVHGVMGVNPAFIQQQMRVVLDDIGADVIKTGMLHNAEVIEAVAEVLDEAPGIPVVVDPVMVAQSGASLLEPEAVRALVRDLAPRASLITPNVPEADRLIGTEIADLEAQRHAAQALLTIGVPAALVKGGHLPGPEIHDVLASADGLEEFSGPRVRTDQTHGTGCTLASAIATGLAQGYDMAGAVRRARAYLRRALETAPGFGKGQGPVNHAWTVQPFDGKS